VLDPNRAERQITRVDPTGVFRPAKPQLRQEWIETMKDITESELSPPEAPPPFEMGRADTAGGDEGGARRGRFQPRRRVILIAVVLALATAGGVYWFLHRNQETTDDAFIDGDIVPLSPRVAGTVAHIYIADNERVHAGELLVELDPSDYEVELEAAQAALAEAEARQRMAEADVGLTRASTAAEIARAESGLAAAQAALAEAEARAAADRAEADRARADLPRYEAAARQGASSRQRLDQAAAAARTSEAMWKAAEQAVSAARAKVAEAQAQLEQARTAPAQVAVKEADAKAAAAQVGAAQARVDQARINLSYTRIVAPGNGHITKRSVNAGDVVQRNQTLATLVLDDRWVTANFKETQLTRMRPGQPVEIDVDAYPGATLTGHVDSIQRGTGARFSLLPPENATGNYVKIVQRVPVKIIFDEPPEQGMVLGLGMSVVPTVDVSASAAPGESADR
jgi:membrane fusion protein (multidrug efflux system)